MAIKKKRKKLSSKKLQRGSIGNFFVYAILLLLIVLGIMAVGGLPSQNAPDTGTVVNPISPKNTANHNTLQLQTFGYTTLVPTRPPATLCTPGGKNNEAGIIVAYSPISGQTISVSGKVRIWVNDEYAPVIAPNEQVNLKTGQITSYGNTSALAHDKFLYEPAVYISPQDAETNLNAGHFPDNIKGDFDNKPPSTKVAIKGAPVDPLPSGSSAPEKFTSMYTWNVGSLNLSPGIVQLEFSIPDGDEDRGFGCITLNVQ